MKYLVKFFVIILFTFHTTLLFSENLIVYINMNKIMNETTAGKSINLQLEKINRINIKEFNSIEVKLKEEETSIIAQKNILSNEEYSKKINALRIKANNYKNNRQKKINLLTKKRIAASANLLKKINPILSDFSKENQISMILPKKNIVLAKTDLDITDKIIKIINAEIKLINLN